MKLPAFILRRIPKGYVLMLESNDKNAAIMELHFRRHRLKPLRAATFEEAKEKLKHKKLLGAVLDHTLANDKEHSGADVLKYIRREMPYDQQKLAAFLVALVPTAVLQEYEYLKVTRYFDTEENRIAFVVDEIATYISG